MEENKNVGKLQEFNERFEMKKREEILNQVPEKFKAMVNEALDHEMKEEYSKTNDICKSILSSEEGKNLEAVKIIAARNYPRLLRADVSEGNQKYAKDVEEYLTFLDGINMNNLMQEYVVETLAKLSGLMELDWYRPKYMAFVQEIEKRGYLTNEEYKDTLSSAYASMESTVYFKDARLSVFVKNALKFGYDKKYMYQEESSDSQKYSMNIDFLTSDFYICNYYSGNEEEFAYVKEKYPHSYLLIAELMEDIAKGLLQKREAVLQKLLTFAAAGTTKEALEEALLNNYREILEKSKRPIQVAKGDNTYYRNMEKIGRNDPCPCGSGKKYKQCCGK